MVGIGSGRAWAAAVLLVAAAAGCSDAPTTPASALSQPIDFSYACEGDGQTQAPANDETAASLTNARMCPDVTELGNAVQGELFGLVLNRHPAGVSVVQMNPATGKREFIDADLFVPGVTAIGVGAAPVRLVRAHDYSAFYALSAGDREVTRIVIKGHVERLDFETSTFALPGVPGDGVALEGTLLVTSSQTAELWRYDLAADAADPPLTVIPLPDRVRELVVHEGRLVVSWIDRPVVSILDANGAIITEAGVVAACLDTLDNDGDTLVDRDDPDCLTSEDDDESDATGAARVAVVPPGAPAFAGAALCDNGVDDDGDGLTDYPADGGCSSATSDGESKAECQDGIDNDGDVDGDGVSEIGDGTSDAEDPACYFGETRVERTLPRQGPFSPTVIDGGDAGTFVYVLDARLGQILVFSLDTPDGPLTRVDVNASDAAPPDIEWVDYDTPSGETETETALAASRSLALQQRQQRNIVMPESNVTTLNSSRLRGEIWDRLIDAAPNAQATVAFDVGSDQWQPKGCDPDRSDVCAQPAGDDATWFAFGPRLDGRIQVIEAIRRGMPMHRLAQSVTALDKRDSEAGPPRLVVGSRLLTTRGAPQKRFAFMGAGIEELLSVAVEGESAARLRRFGIWPPEDVEQALTEPWTVTYEGTIPNTRGVLGRMTADDRFFSAPEAFCEAGVAVGDWLVLQLPRASSSEELHHDVPIVDERGRTCPVKARDTTLVEVRITEVGMTSLGVDPATARLRARVDALDEDAIEAAGLSLRLCQSAQQDLAESIGLPAHLETTSAFTASNVASRFTYRVRVADAWALVGARSGFLHRQRWDRTSGTCVIDDTLDERLDGRHAQVDDSVVEDYTSCPPPAEQLKADTIEALAPADDRFENPSLLLDILPGCDVDETGAIVPVPSQQSTQWSFTITGPDAPSSLAIGDASRISLLGVRIPMLDFRRQQVQLDTSANRASVLQVRPNDPRIITIYE